MKQFMLTIMVFLSLVVGVFASQIPPFYLDSTVVIGVPSENNTVMWTGSGFLYGVLANKTPDQKKYYLYIVTNKHVLEGLNAIYVRFNSEVGPQGNDYLVSLKENNKQLWEGHRDNDIDIAVIPVEPSVLRNDKMRFNYFRDDQHVMTLSDMKEQGVTEGDPIYLLGYPLGMVNTNSQYVIARFGIIAKVRDTLATHGKGFVIDTKNYPGNSGGPVILKTEATSIEGTKPINKAQLIGVVNSYIPYTDIAISAQTKRPRITFEENSGLANVIPVDYVRETISQHRDKVGTPIVK